MKALERAKDDALESIQNLAHAIAGYQKAASVAEEMQHLGFDPDSEVIHSAYCFSEEIYVSFGDGTDQKEMAKIVRDFVVKTGASLSKNPNSGNTGLDATGTFRGVRIRFGNYLPPSCRIETEDVEVPAHTKVVSKVICIGKFEDEVETLEQLKREASEAPPPE